jgi:hypothetical protein
MIDITKEDFLNYRFGEIEKIDEQTIKEKGNIQKNNVIAISIGIFAILAIVNSFLVYTFFKIFVNL